MDDEDIREAEETKVLSTADDYAGFGTEFDPNRKIEIPELFRSSGETMGTRLLKKMGWREGQGIGPRVRRRAKLDEDETGSDDLHLFAPDDPPMISFNHKRDFNGVGYDGQLPGMPALPKQRNNNEEAEESRSSMGVRDGSTSLKKPQVQKGGFGVGILNDTGSDDEDPYEMGPRISYNRIMGGEKKAKKKGLGPITAGNPLLKEKPVFLSKKVIDNRPLAGFRKCHDGRLPLAGFVLSTELDSFLSLSLNADELKPLDVPPGWTSKKSTTSSETQRPYVSTRDAAKTSTLNAQSRSAILGETQLPGKSVFDFLDQAARERLANASGKSDLPPAKHENTPMSPAMASDEALNLASIESSIAHQALTRTETGWTPYPDNSAKARRYQTFLTHSSTSSPASALLSTRPTHMKQSEFAHELAEFTRVTQVFAPVSGLMASRFTISTTTQSQDASENTSTDLLRKAAAKPTDPAVEAAQMGMFGPGLTRFVDSWAPPTLLCKRFNVPVPDASKIPSTSARTTFQAPRSAGMGDSSASPPPPPGKKIFASGPYEDQQSSAAIHHAGDRDNASGPGTVAVVVVPERNEVLEQERPGQAVFRAIFGSDDDDDD